MPRRTYAYKLYRHKRNRHLHRQISIGGQIHNACIALHRRYYRRFGKHLPLFRLQKQLAKRKRWKRYQHWKILGSQAIQNIAERIELGYQKFFRKENKRPPGFRKVRKAKSFTLKHAGWNLGGDNRLLVGKTVYKFSKSRDIDGAIKTVTIKRDAVGDLFVFFSCLVEGESPSRSMTGNSAGFDFGLKTFLTGSDGTRIEAPQPLRAALATLKAANRSFSRKMKGSVNHARARAHLARVHRRVRHQRTAWHWYLARNLCTSYDVIFLEDLELRGMQRLWGRKMSDLGHGNFLRILPHVASKTGAILGYVGRFFPSSKLCNACGAINHTLELRERHWVCGCGCIHDRDTNAAINIYREGASSLGVGGVRLASPATAV